MEELASTGDGTVVSLATTEESANVCPSPPLCSPAKERRSRRVYRYGYLNDVGARSYSLYLAASRIVLYILVCFKSRTSPNKFDVLSERYCRLSP